MDIAEIPDALIVLTGIATGTLHAGRLGMQGTVSVLNRSTLLAHGSAIRYEGVRGATRRVSHYRSVTIAHLAIYRFAR